MATVEVDEQEYRQLKAVVVAAAMWRAAYKERLEYARSVNAGEQERLMSHQVQLWQDEGKLERAFFEVIDGMPADLMRRLGKEALREHYDQRDRAANQTPAATG